MKIFSISSRNGVKSPIRGVKIYFYRDGIGIDKFKFVLGNIMQIHGKHLVTILVGAILALSVGCSGEPQPVVKAPPKISAQELAQQQEAEKRHLEAEEKRRQEEAFAAEEQRKSTAMMEEFGPVGEPPPPFADDREAPEIAQSGGSAVSEGGETSVSQATSEPSPPRSDDMALGVKEIPYEEAVPPPPQPPTVRVAVLSSQSQPEKGQNIALILGTYRRDMLEELMGMAVEIAYISHMKQDVTRQSAIHFRPNFLRAAVSVASVLPREQDLRPMSADEQRQESVDLLVYVGKNYR